MTRGISPVDVAQAIADGIPVDWVAAESSATGDADRARIRGLRLLSEVARFHATLHTSAVSSSQLHDSILHPPGRAVDSSDVETPEVAVQWGPLKILEKVGRGTFGDVYRAWDPRLDREVALKLLRRRDAESDTLGSSVIEEGRLQARVRHPGVITIHGADRIEERVGLWMEFIQGRTLEQELRDRGPFDADEVARIGVDLCRALSAVHDEGLLHRDIKAQNVMRDTKGRLVLGDFGTGRELDEGIDTPARDVAGTPLYLAPEIFARQPATVQSDLYSLGVLLYHLVTGSFPVRGRRARDIQDAHAVGSRIPLGTARPDLPHVFVQAVERAIAPAPEGRYTSAAEMEGVLLEALGDVVPTGAAIPADEGVARAPARWLSVALGAALLVTVVGATYWLVPASPPGVTEQSGRPNAVFGQGDSVLISQFENLTEEALFDGTVEYALGRELSNSSFVRVASPERVQDALRLMQLPVETVVDAAVGREVALRDGGIRVVLAGRIEKLGPSYLLTVQVVDPADGSVVASVSEEARSERTVASAIRRQASQVREVLGEALPLIEASEELLEQVTTPSLRALQLYSRGYVSFDEEKRAAAAELFKAAIAEDPAFAAAHNMLGWSIRAQRRPLEEALPYFERAVELAAHTTERDRLFIEGSYYTQTGQLDEAIVKYEALVGLYPDHFYGNNNLRVHYRQRGRIDDALRLPVQRADLRPNDWTSQYNAATALTEAWRLDRAKQHIERLRVLPRPQIVGRRSQFISAWLDFFPVYEHWFRGDLEATIQTVEAVSRTIPSLSIDQQWIYLQKAATFYLAVGQLVKARELIESIPDANQRHDYLAALADFVDDEEGTRDHLNAISPDSPLGRRH